jgi:signal transduction histidine kinase
MSTGSRISDDRNWPPGDSQTARLLRGFDWAATGLGPIAAWPQSWRSAVEIMLAAPVPMSLRWGPDGLMLYNDAYIPIAGDKHPAAWGRPFDDVWPEVAEFDRDVMARCLAGESLVFQQQPFVLQRGPMPESVWLNLYYNPVRDEAGTVVAVLGIVREVTAIIQTEHSRRHEESVERQMRAGLEQQVQEVVADRQLWVDIVECTQDPIAVLDKQFRYLAFNQAYRRDVHRVLGLGEVPRQRLEIGMTFDEAWRDFPEALETRRALWARALEGHEFEATIRVAEIAVTDEEDDGGDRGPTHYDLAFRPLRGADGSDIGAFVHCRDVSARERARRRLERAESALRQSQKMEAVGQLTGGIAHDFNNLLGGILGALEMLDRRIEEGRTSDLQRYVRIASTSAERAAALTQRLLAFARRQPLDPKPVDANELLTSMEDLLRRTLGPEIVLDIVRADALWPSLCDPNQLESAVLNLAINARDAMAEGGRLTIETANARLDARSRIHQGEVTPGSYVAISFTDTGAGMPPEVLNHVFEPFFTTKPTGQGTGLGLSMLYGFVKQSGGHVHIHSEVGLGTTVHVYLPRYQAPRDIAADGEDEEVPPVPVAGDGERILVVEDEGPLRILIAEALRDMGYRPIEADTAASGLAILHEMPVDLLVTDVGLPGGMNGRQMAEAARAGRPDLKVLFITGYAHRPSLGEGPILEPGMDMLAKPFSLDRLAQKIREMMGPP